MQKEVATHTAEEIKALAETIYPVRSNNGQSGLIRDAFINGYTKALEQVKMEGYQLETIRKALIQISNAGLSPKFIVDIARAALAHPVSRETIITPPSQPLQQS